MKRFVFVGVILVFAIIPNAALASLLNLGSEQIVQAGGADLVVNGHSVPSYVDWNNDGKGDLVIGEDDGGSREGKVRVYLNVGTASNPQFSDFFYAQSDGSDLTLFASGCLGAFPRTVYWDGDDRKDLIVGETYGTVMLYLNVGTDDNPTFDGGTALQVGPSGSEVDIDVGYRATPIVVDWDSDGSKDLAVGGLDGKMHIFVNEGTDTAPDFLVETFAQEDGSDLVVPSERSSAVIEDLDGDGKKDLLAGNTDGELLFYSNVGTDEAPLFSGYTLIESDGIAIDLLGTPRSRPFLCDWSGDGYSDILIGADDGKVHLFQGVPEPATISLLGLGVLALLRRKRA